MLAEWQIPVPSSLDEQQAIVDEVLAEQALINNDQMQLQGLAMMQEAERRLAEQQDREKLADQLQRSMNEFKAGFQ